MQHYVTAWMSNDPEDIRALFSDLGPQCRILITTRDAGIITALGAREYRLGLLSPDASAEDSRTPSRAVPSTPCAQHISGIPNKDAGGVNTTEEVRLGSLARSWRDVSRRAYTSKFSVSRRLLFRHAPSNPAAAGYTGLLLGALLEELLRPAVSVAAASAAPTGASC
jgi:hypothetical protein